MLDIASTAVPVTHPAPSAACAVAAAIAATPGQPVCDDRLTANRARWARRIRRAADDLHPVCSPGMKAALEDFTVARLRANADDDEAMAPEALSLRRSKLEELHDLVATAPALTIGDVAAKIALAMETENGGALLRRERAEAIVADPSGEDVSLVVLAHAYLDCLRLSQPAPTGAAFAERVAKIDELHAQVEALRATFNAAEEAMLAARGDETLRAAVDPAETAWMEAADRRDDLIEALLREVTTDPAIAHAKQELLNRFRIDPGSPVAETASEAARADFRAMATADTYLLSLAPELERCTARERETDAAPLDEITDGRLDADSDATCKVCAAIIATPARTLAGYALKARAVAAFFNEEDHARTAFSRGAFGARCGADYRTDAVFDQLLAGYGPPAQVSLGVTTAAPAVAS